MGLETAIRAVLVGDFHRFFKSRMCEWEVETMLRPRTLISNNKTQRKAKTTLMPLENLPSSKDFLPIPRTYCLRGVPNNAASGYGARLFAQ